MTFDILLAGVGGQGVLSAAAIIAHAAVAAGLDVKQSEVHGMAQRGGSVVAHLRLADRPISSALVPAGSADLIIAAELLEALRQLRYLAQRGAFIAARTELRTMDDYPDTDRIVAQLRCAGPLHLLDAEAIAREAGSVKAATTVLLGAAAVYLPIPLDEIRRSIQARFAWKSRRVLDANLAALEAGSRHAVPNRSVEGVEAGGGG